MGFVMDIIMEMKDKHIIIMEQVGIIIIIINLLQFKLNPYMELNHYINVNHY